MLTRHELVVAPAEYLAVLGVIRASKDTVEMIR